LPRKISPQQENQPATGKPAEFSSLQFPVHAMGGKPRSDVWGVDAVKPRDVGNGIEDAELSNTYETPVLQKLDRLAKLAIIWSEAKRKPPYEC
jgi:hypothetical protein